MSVSMTYFIIALTYLCTYDTYVWLYVNAVTNAEESTSHTFWNLYAMPIP